MVFVNSMSDVFHEQVSEAFVDQMFAVMAMASQHTFQILTKRPKRMHQYLTDPQTVLRIADAIDRRNDRQGYDVLAQDLRDGHAWPLPNVWLGVSVEDQRRAEERMPWLQQTPAAIRFLSCEPLLGPLDLTA
jgi:protein gp37